MRCPQGVKRSRIRGFARSEDGNTAIEFAFAATLVLALIFAGIDLGRAMIVGGLLGDSARRISRENQVLETALDSSEFNAAAAAVIASRASGFLNPNEVTIETTVYESFDALASGTEANGAPPGGDPGQIVKYRLSYDMDYYTPFVELLMTGAQYSHISEIIVYNEPDNDL